MAVVPAAARDFSIDPPATAFAADMNDRARAVAILQQVRDILAQRLTERVVEARDDLLDDAHGNSYSGEIEQLYEQLGLRLSHVSSMLSCLPPVNEPTNAELTLAPAVDVIVTDTGGHHSAATAALTFSTETRALDRLVRLVESSEERSATALIAELCELPAARAAQCAEQLQSFSKPGECMARLAALRQSIAGDNTPEALAALWEALGLQGSEALNALQALRSRAELL